MSMLLGGERQRPPLKRGSDDQMTMASMAADLALAALSGPDGARIAALAMRDFDRWTVDALRYIVRDRAAVDFIRSAMGNHRSSIAWGDERDARQAERNAQLEAVRERVLDLLAKG